MAVLADTATVEPRDRVAYWARVQETLFCPLDLEVGDPGAPFRGRAHGWELGPVQVRRVEAGAGSVHRTEQTISGADPERLELTMMVRGTQERVQEGRRAVLAAGDLTSVDTSVPYSVASPAAFEMLVFSVPKRLLARDADRLCRATATPIRADAGIAAIIGPFLRHVGDGLLDGRVREQDTSLGDGIVDLVRGLYAGRERPAVASPRSLLFEEVLRSVEERLHDPALSPASVAGAHFVSVRHLHRLFEDEGVTFSEWVRDRRLERCRRDLADPVLACETVLSVAVSWGFRNPSHFSRLFRAAYGCSPSAVRPGR
jgi:AraC-like DNA-binding protein